MEKNRKLIILIIFILLAIIIWMPKGKKRGQTLPGPSVSSEKAVPPGASAQRGRTEFVEWGRNPFVWPGAAEGPISDLRLSGIIWDEEFSYAIINGAVVHAGEEIAGRTVKRIDPDKVIISDGLKDYVLELK